MGIRNFKKTKRGHTKIMRIKSIKGTKEFKKIDFSHIKSEWEENNKDLRILTPQGWTHILNFGYIKSGPAKIVKTKNETLICDPGHVLKVRRNNANISLKVQELTNEDQLYSYNDELIGFEISDDFNTHDFYDITIANPHWYYTSDVVSHNSVMLCNNAITSLKGIGKDGQPGQDVLFITFELDVFKTAMRILGSATGVPMDNIPDKQDYVKRLMEQIQKTYNKKLLIYEMPPDECSVNHIYALLDNLRRKHNWHPDVLILDYLDLLVSRQPSYNKDDYTRQKHVANEIRGLAKNENVLIFTATQTNRSGAGEDGIVDLTKASESFGKQFSLDYIVSLNQTSADRTATPPRLRMFIAKNRNGPKHEVINCTIDYNTMVVKEAPF
jgi:hypothetical protein